MAHTLLPECYTPFCKWALGTFWGLRRTYHSSKVHDSLIVSSRLMHGQQLLRHSVKLMFACRRVNGCLNTQYTSQDTIDIAINNCDRQPKSDATDCRCCVLTHPFQTENFFKSCWEPTHADNLLRCGVQISCPAVIAEPLPQPQHLVFGGCCQLLYIWKTPHEPFPIRPALLHACLLKDDFAKPNSIRILRGAPRQLSPVLCKPPQEYG